MNTIKNVLIIFGGNSKEHYVSCKSAKSIIENINIELFSYKIVGIDFKNEWYEYNDNLSYLEIGNWKKAKIKRIDNIIKYLKQFDVVFPITHGTNGEDGKLQGMLELFNMKFVGCKTSSSSILMDKDISKMLFNSLNIKQVPYISLMQNDLDIKKINLNYPLIVKPANGGSSIGISKVNNIKELNIAIKEAFKYDNKIIVEEFVKVRELEIAVLENDGKIILSNPGEIKSANEFYDYNAKYKNDKSYTKICTDLKDNILKQIKDYSYKIINKLGIKGYARIDYFYDEENEIIYINEVNTIPGFTEISMYPKLIEDTGISYRDLITLLINTTLI